MIQMIQIIEGGVDLRNGEEIGPMLVLFNGKQKMNLEVSADQVKEVVQFWADGAQVQQEVAPQPAVVHRQTVSKATPAADPPGTFAPFEEEEEPDDEPPAVGEEYSDSGTGVAAW